MCGRKVLGCALFSVIFLLLSTSVVSEILNCSFIIPSEPFSIDGGNSRISIENPKLLFKVNRDSLGIYEYPGTPSVNLFISDTAVFFKGEIKTENASSAEKYERIFRTEALGVANMVNSNKLGASLKDCQFFVVDKQTGSFYNEMPNLLDSMAAQAIEQCISMKLCDLIGTVRETDVARARSNPRDFGPMSIWSRTLQTNFPKMKPPKLTENNKPEKRANLVEAAESIVRNLAEIFQYNTNGTLDLPDLKSGFSSASDGTFAGLNHLQMDTSVQVRASPSGQPFQTFSFSFGIPVGYVKYNKFKPIRIIPGLGSLCADVKDIIFSATVQMDFSQKYCRSNLLDFKTTNNGTSKSYTCGTLSFITNPVMQWFVNVWDSRIINVIESKIEWLMASYIYDKFDCENFRTSNKY